MADLPIWLIGCGNMAGAMLKGWLAAGEAAERFRIIDPAQPDLPDGVTSSDAPPSGGFGAAIVQLGVKPQMVGEIAPTLAPYVGGDTIIVSIMAGVEIETLRSLFPDAGAIIRVMPNMPVAYRMGAVGLFAEQSGDARAEAVASEMAKLGTAEWLDAEELIDVVTALGGSGPAFVFRFIDALARGGRELGLDEGQAQRLAMAMVRGAAEQAAVAEEGPDDLAERVASPGGTTRKGLDVLDSGDALADLVAKTLKAATERSRELAAEARR